ncbi:MAG: UDP-3-O-acyl-N-acetylglucosamine deacetylase [Alphaproteobacteria bacterium]|nr:MAG: UDP-3-O-acyl-N-acetylglucosamine deacetylase [Alphaproteobacteria bacterium]
MVSCTGIGLHTGQEVTMTLHPAPVDTGIVFDRIDLTLEDTRIPARFDHVGETMLGTVVANQAGASVSTVEHLMAALAGLGIDNMLVEIDGPELPVMDGSSSDFVTLLEAAGVRSQGRTRKYIKILSPILFEDGDKSGELRPGHGFSAEFEIEFANAAIGRQRYEFDLAPGAFKEELADARTFGFLKDLDQLLALGLGRGASVENTIVIEDEAVINEDGLRYSDEFVRHKVLDAIGDLYLAGAPILGHFVGVKSGHGVNNALLRALFSQPEKWTYVEDAAQAPEFLPLTAEEARQAALG